MYCLWYCSIIVQSNPSQKSTKTWDTKQGTYTGRGLELQGGSNPSIGVPGDVRRGDEGQGQYIAQMDN